MVPSVDWWLIAEDHILWPHLPWLHIIVQVLPMHLLVPVDQHGLCNAPHGDLHAALYWYEMGSQVEQDWPRALHTRHPSLLFVNTVHRLKSGGLFRGKHGWTLEYGYPDHSSYITAVVYDENTVSMIALWKGKRLFQAALKLLGLPVNLLGKDYRLAIWQLAQTSW